MVENQIQALVSVAFIVGLLTFNFALKVSSIALNIKGCRKFLFML